MGINTFTAPISNERLAAILDVIEEHPSSNAQAIADLAGYKTIRTLRKFLGFLERGGEIKGESYPGGRRYTIKKRKPREVILKVGKAIPSAPKRVDSDMPRREFVGNKGWPPHHFRDWAVAAVFGPAKVIA